MNVTALYQIVGFRPNLNWYRVYNKNDYVKLSNVIIGDNSPWRQSQKGSKAPIELILGIDYSGRSYILLTHAQAESIAQTFRLERPNRRASRQATDFESLSPIYFSSPEELSAALTTYAVVSKKNRVAADNSHANKHFENGDAGIVRGEFEHGRVFYKILQKPDTFDLAKFGIEDDFWKNSVRICAFTYNTYLQDQRPLEERQSNPKFIDLGWSEFAVPDLQAKSTTHIILAENRNLGATGLQKLQVEYGTTETLDRYVVSSRLQDLFKDNQQVTDRPLILLVKDADITLKALRRLGVDTSKWVSGIKELLRHQPFKVEHGPSRPGDPRIKHESWTPDSRSTPSGQRGYLKSERRSRSPPPRRGTYNSHSSYRDSRESSSSSSYRPRPASPSRLNAGGPAARRRLYAPVYVVDVQRLFIKLMRAETHSKTVADMARHLLSSNVTGRCAGNEVHLLMGLWRNMIEGSSIVQRSPPAIVPSAGAGPSATDSKPKPEPANSDSDSDVDPNDMIPDASVQAKGSEPYEIDDDDFGDGDSSDSD